METVGAVRVHRDRVGLSGGLVRGGHLDGDGERPRAGQAERTVIVRHAAELDLIRGAVVGGVRSDRDARSPGGHLGVVGDRRRAERGIEVGRRGSELQRTQRGVVAHGRRRRRAAGPCAVVDRAHRPHTHRVLGAVGQTRNRVAQGGRQLRDRLAVAGVVVLAARLPLHLILDNGVLDRRGRGVGGRIPGDGELSIARSDRHIARRDRGVARMVAAEERDLAELPAWRPTAGFHGRRVTPDPKSPAFRMPYKDREAVSP